MSNQTIFEKEWANPSAPFLYRNEEIGVGVIADTFPKFPDQVVIIPAQGFAERRSASLHHLDLQTYFALRTLEKVIQAKMETFSGVEGVRGVIRVDGFAVPNHPHIVMFPSLRGESDDFTKPPRPQFKDKVVRNLLIERTLQNLQFTEGENSMLDTILTKIMNSDIGGA